jgi:hypothetical protein
MMQLSQTARVAKFDIEKLLQNPRSQPCEKACTACKRIRKNLSPQLIEAALFSWDDLARAGYFTYPPQIVRIMRDLGIPFNGAAVSTLINHRRINLLRREAAERKGEKYDLRAAGIAAHKASAV